MKRSTNYTIAAILHALLSLGNIMWALDYLPRGAEALNQGGDTPPYAVMVLSLVIGVLGVVSAWGIWQNKRWGVVLTIVLEVIGGLSALPGLIFALTPTLTIMAAFSVLASIAVIALLLWPQPRPQAAEST